MIEIKAKLKIARSAYKVEVQGTAGAAVRARQKSRLRTQLASGEEVALMLPRGEVLRGGDLVVASDGRVIEVVARAGAGAARRMRHAAGARARRLPPRQPPRAGRGRRGLPAHRRGPRARGDAAQARRAGDRTSRRRSSPRPARTPAATSISTTKWAHGGKIHEYGDHDMTTTTITTMTIDHDMRRMTTSIDPRPAAAREPGAAGGRVQLLAGPRGGGRGGHRAATRRARSAGSATCSSSRVAPHGGAGACCRRDAQATPRPQRWNELFLASRETRGAARRDGADGLLARALLPELGVERARRMDEVVVSRGVRARRGALEASRRATR